MDGRDLTPQNSVIDLLSLASVTEIAVATTGVAYTKHFVLPRNVSFGGLIKLSSAGAIDVKVELEEGNTEPTDQAADVSGKWGVGQTVSSGLTSAGPHVLLVSPIVARYARLKFTGQGSNAASTKVTIAQIAVTKNS